MLERDKAGEDNQITADPVTVFLNVVLCAHRTFRVWRSALSGELGFSRLCSRLAPWASVGQGASCSVVSLTAPGLRRISA